MRGCRIILNVVVYCGPLSLLWLTTLLLVTSENCSLKDLQSYWKGEYFTLILYFQQYSKHFYYYILNKFTFSLVHIRPVTYKPKRCGRYLKVASDKCYLFLVKEVSLESTDIVLYWLHICITAQTMTSIVINVLGDKFGLCLWLLSCDNLKWHKVYTLKMYILISLINNVRNNLCL